MEHTVQAYYARIGTRHSLDGVRLQECGAAAESVALGTELLAVADLAVDFLIGTITGVRRVQDFTALVAVEAGLVVALENRQCANFLLIMRVHCAFQIHRYAFLKTATNNNTIFLVATKSHYPSVVIRYPST